ncbi:MAG: hypothetical protein ACAH95_12295 [Fimbriimonas sp.]
MQFHSFRRTLAALLFAATAALSLAQTLELEQRSVVGRPWKGSVGIKATTKQIMQWQALNGHGFKYLVMPTERDETLEYLPGPPALPGPQFPARNSTIEALGLVAPPQARFSVGVSWDGAGFDDETAPAFIPPDTMGDVGPNNVLVVVNNWIKLWNRTGTLGALNAHLNTFFNSVRGGANVGDSRVRFDRLSQRWIITTFTAESSNNKILIAVSDSANLTASTVWTFFSFQHNVVTPAGDTGLFFDYPTLGVDSQALYIGGNVFGGAFTTSAFVVRKSSILGAGPIVVTAFRNLYNGGNGIITPQGVDHDDPASTDGFILGHGGHFNTMRMHKITDPGGTPVLGPVQSVSGMLSDSQPVSVPALGSAKNLDGGDLRLLKAAIHTNALTGLKTIWTTGSISVTSAGSITSGNRTATRWYEVHNFSTTPSIRQAGTIFDTAASNQKHFWMATAAMNRQGHAVVGMSVSGALQNASIAVSDRLSSDALGNLSAPTQIVAGTSAYNLDSGDPVYRWGDYSNTVVDPTDGMSIWTFQEYCNALNNWEVRVIKLLAPPPATPTATTPTSAAQGSTVTLAVTGTSSNGSGFFDAGTGFTSHMGASFSGTGITVTAVRFISPTSIEIDATLAEDAAETTRSLTVTNPDGQQVQVTNFFTVTSGAPTLSSVSLPATIASGATVNGTVTLDRAARSGGAVVTLSSNNAVLTVPASVTVTQGNTTANFSATAGTVSSPVQGTVTAHFVVDRTADYEVRAAELVSLSLNRTSIVGGSTATGVAKVTLEQAAPTGGLTIQLSAGSLISIPSTVKVAAGSLTGQVNFSAPTAVSTATNQTVTASWQGVDKSKDILVQPPTPSKLQFTPSVLIGGSQTVVTGTVTLSQTAPTGGVVVTLECASLLLTVPANVTVLEGQTQASFTITHKSVPTQKIISVQALSGGVKKAAKVTLNPPGIGSITCDPKSIIGGTGASISGTVALNAPAASGGCDVVLTTSSGELTVTPTTVHFNATNSSKPFTITAPSSIQANKSVTITATLNGTKTVIVTVVAPKVSSVSVTPSTVVGGSSTVVTFKVNLNAPAPAGGYVVSLNSSNPSVGSVPATVTVPAGATTASVTVTHSAVGATNFVGLSATVNGVTKSTTLTVTQ